MTRHSRHAIGNPADPDHPRQPGRVRTVGTSRRLIAMVLAVASVVLLVDAVLRGWRLATAGGAWDDWAPAGVLLVAGIILLLGARAALNPEVTPELPETSSPDHIEH